MINQNTNKGSINIDFITPGAGGTGAVKSVNGKTGTVVLTAEDVHALPEDTYIPSTDGLASIEYVDAAVKNVEVDLTGYATEEYVKEAVKDVEVDLTGYATEEYVDAAVEGLEGPEGPQGPPGDSGVYVGSKEPTDESVKVWIDVQGQPSGELATRAYVDEAIAAIPEVDLTDYALKTDIPSTAGLATEEYVNEQIDAIEIPDNTPIATLEVAGKVKPDGTTITITEEGIISSIGGGSSEGTEDVYVGTEEPDETSEALLWINPEGEESEGLATKKYVDEAIAASSGGETDLSDYYNKAEVDLLIADFTTEERVNELINTALGVIENGTY